MAAVLHIDVYVDLICPWCLIGKRYLDAALLQFQQTAPGVEVEVVWHSVQLLPDAPLEGWDFEAFYLKRLGSHAGMRQRQAQVNAAAGKAGFQIDFTGIARMPNTLLAHQLLGFASSHLAAEPFAVLLEQLFVSHFHLGGNLGERDTLLRIAASHGLDLVALEAWMASGAGQPLALDVPGVPFFVFNQTLALSGAQPPEVLLGAMRQAHAQAVLRHDAPANGDASAEANAAGDGDENGRTGADAPAEAML